MGTRAGLPSWNPWTLAVGGATSLLLVVVASRYGWHRDELYFLEAGHHLQWGYVDQPPLTPFVARLADTVARDNLVVLRLVPALATGGSVVTGGLLVRELGGRGRAQLLGSAAVAGGGFLLGAGHLLSTATFDLLAWSIILWLVARLLRTADPRWWVAVGGVAGLSMLNKNLIVLLAVSLGAGLLIARRWELVRTPWLPVGVALMLTIAAPNLWWQATNGWPQLDMAQALSERLAAENRILLLPMQVLLLSPLLIGVLLRGVRWLRSEDGTPFVALLWAWPAALAVTFITGGRPYYALPLTITVMLAGIRTVRVDEEHGHARVIGLTVVTSAVIALPLLPVSAVPVTGAANEAVAETVGWPEMVDQVDAVVDDLPAGERDDVILLALTYGEAGALDRFGGAHGLPPAYSPHNGYADFRQPSDPDATVVAVRYSPDWLGAYFDRCDQAATVDNGLDLDNEAQGAPIVVCRGLRGSWSTTWEALRHLS